MRLFFAVLPDPGAALQLAELTSGARLEHPARAVAYENLHMTLAFIGGVEAPAVARLRALGAEISASSAPLCVDRIEWWPEAQVLVATARPAPALRALVEELRRALALLGYRDAKPWRAHVTLARKVLQPPVLQAMSPICWQPKEFALMQSARGDRGSVYTVVDTWPLLDESAAAAKSR